LVTRRKRIRRRFRFPLLFSRRFSNCSGNGDRSQRRRCVVENGPIDFYCANIWSWRGSLRLRHVSAREREDRRQKQQARENGQGTLAVNGTHENLGCWHENSSC